MKDITFAVIGSGFMGTILAQTASEVPYAECVGAADILLPRAQGLTAWLVAGLMKTFVKCWIRKIQPCVRCHARNNPPRTSYCSRKTWRPCLSGKADGNVSGRCGCD